MHRLLRATVIVSFLALAATPLLFRVLHQRDAERPLSVPIPSASRTDVTDRETATVYPPAASPRETASGPVEANTVPPQPNNEAEVVATWRMYLAHESLRAPEEADPDSRANRVILQTMVDKALTDARAVPAPAKTVTP